MITRKQISAVFLTTFLCLLWAEGMVTAAPMPPLLVVNHDSKECAEIFGGDECMDCFPPEGWEILGGSSQAQCPPSYDWIQELDYTCQGFKNQRCCTEGHTGAHGSCQDLVINEREKQCAFVETIDTCALPKNWRGKPADLQPVDWFCPAEYQWLDRSLDCAPAGADAVESTDTDSSRSFCPLTTALGPAFILLGLLIRKTY
jgi:hypothetical protein